ncbi:HigA family addiction module antitoxin [Leptospira santarosai]|uniref:HigA family addiction module antitoxin n=1 Tax=Leptospira santarosai TaxID=28183 RepID=UPI0039B08E44
MHQENFHNFSWSLIRGLGHSGYRLSKETGIPESKISDIIHGKRNITVSISIKLGKFFDLNPHFWIGLQNDYDIREEQHKLAKVLKSMKSYKDFYKDQDSKKVTPFLA